MSFQPRSFYYGTGSTPLPFSTVEQLYALRERLDAFQAHLFFNSESSRIIWSDDQYNYSRRLEQLGENGTASPYDTLQFPFASYYRSGNWELDDRSGAHQLSSAMHKIRWGRDNTGVEAQLYHAQRSFQGIAFFTSERDAEIAFTLLQWWKNRLHQDEYSLLASGTEVLFPLSLELVSAVLDTGKNLDQWSKSQNISAVRYEFLVRTPLVKLPPDQPPVYLTKEVAWYFHNRVFRPGLDEEGDIPLELSELLYLEATGEEAAPDLLNGLANIEFLTSSDTAAFSWEYLGVALPDSIQFIVHLGNTVHTEVITFQSGETVDDAATEYTLEGLPSGSVFDVMMLVTYGTKINKYHFSISTPAIPERRIGLAGLKGMTL